MRKLIIVILQTHLAHGPLPTCPNYNDNSIIIKVLLNYTELRFKFFSRPILVQNPRSANDAWSTCL
jgi:hypothetical protein